MTPGRNRAHHHVPHRSPDTLYNFVLATIFNLKFNIAKENAI